MHVILKEKVYSERRTLSGLSRLLKAGLRRYETKFKVQTDGMEK